MRCEEIADQLPMIMDRPGTADRSVVGHVETCLRCQAELAHYRRLLRLLHQLKTQGPEPPPGAVGDIIAMLEESVERGAIRSALTGRPAAYVGGLVATAGAAGAVIVLANRSRSRKMGLAG